MWLDRFPWISVGAWGPHSLRPTPNPFIFCGATNHCFPLWNELKPLGHHSLSVLLAVSVPRADLLQATMPNSTHTLWGGGVPRGREAQVYLLLVR